VRFLAIQPIEEFWLLIRCRCSQRLRLIRAKVAAPFLRTLSLPRRPVAVENQADGVRALARRDRRRIAAAVGFQCLQDRSRVARLPILGLRDEFVAAGAISCRPPATCRNSSFSPATFCSPSVWLAGQVGIV
jgi:hypothetical protein